MFKCPPEVASPSHASWGGLSNVPRGRVASSWLTSFFPLLELVYYDMERCHGNGLKRLRRVNRGSYMGVGSSPTRSVLPQLEESIVAYARTFAAGTGSIEDWRTENLPDVRLFLKRRQPDDRRSHERHIPRPSPFA